jgi:hypothetical protein
MPAFDSRNEIPFAPNIADNRDRSSLDAAAFIGEGKLVLDPHIQSSAAGGTMAVDDGQG